MSEEKEIKEKKEFDAEKFAEKVEEKAKVFNKIISNSCELVFKDVEKILGRSLNEKEKADLEKSEKAFFMITTLMMQAMV